jgi:pimeloyl-ACP methyl ester carboxylesterase
MAATAEFDDFFYASPDGLKLHARVYGDGIEGPLPAICLPGLTRNARDFHELALHLSRGARTPRKVVAFDYRGRGQSDHDRNWRNYDPLVETGDILAGLVALGIERGAFIGTSRGGLIIFAIAAMRPALLKAAVLNDVGPVIDGAGVAQIRGYLERAPKPRDMAEAIAIQKAAQAASFPALTDADWERAGRAFFRDDGGRLVADFDPALLRTLKRIDLSKPLPTLWPQFLGLRSIPVLAIRGENSRLTSAETHEEMARQHPDIRTVTVAGQGHAPFLETAGLPDKIAAFLESADKKAG